MVGATEHIRPVGLGPVLLVCVPAAGIPRPFRYQGPVICYHTAVRLHIGDLDDDGFGRLADACYGAGDPDVTDADVGAFLGEDWADITAFVTVGDEHGAVSKLSAFALAVAGKAGVSA